MFLNKIEKQKLELERALTRNEYFKTKCSLLEDECKVLAARIVKSQIFRAEENETLIMLKKSVADIEQAVEQRNHELNTSEVHLNSLESKMEDLEQSANSSMVDSENVSDELLQIKNEMIKCLQEELIHVRLYQAEQFAQIQEMRNTERELSAELDKMTKEEPETLAQLQEELMTHKVQEIEILGQFQSIKELLVNMKVEHDLHVKTEQGGSSENKKVDGTVKINKGKAIWNSLDKSKRKECKSEENIKCLEEEKNDLYTKIEDLQKVIEIQNKHLHHREEEKQRLTELLKNTKIKTESSENMILERARQCQHLESSGNDKIIAIMQSIGEKDNNIIKLKTDLEKISKRRHSHLLQNSDMTEACTVNDLENQIVDLKQKIKNLHLDIVEIQHKKAEN